MIFLLAFSPGDYKSTLEKFEQFIEDKKDQRDFLFNWLAWWDQRKSHFVKAFKHVSAPTTNLSEGYNSKYVTSNNINF